MPVILHDHDYDRWLTRDYAEALNDGRPPNPAQLMAVECSTPASSLGENRGRRSADAGFEGLREFSRATEDKPLDGFQYKRGVPDKVYFGVVGAMAIVALICIITVYVIPLR